jgi:tetratricopeptide (TPR) repeat protein
MSESWRNLLLYADDDRTTFGERFVVLRETAARGQADEAFEEAMEMAVGLHQAGLDREALGLLDEASTFLTPENVPADEWPWFFNTRGMALSGVGRHPEADDDYERMHQLAEELPRGRKTDQLVSTALQNAGVNALGAGDGDRGVALLARAADMKRQLEDWVSAVDVLTALAMAVAQTGDVRAALAMLDNALELSQTLGQPRRVAAVLGNQAALEARLGNPAQAEVKLRAVLDYVRYEGDPLRELQTMQGVGSSLLDQNRPGEGLRWYRRAHRLAHERGTAVMEVRLQRNIATALVHLGREAEAAEELTQAVIRAESIEQNVLAGEALADLGALYVNLGDVTGAGIYLRRALAVFEELHDDEWRSRLNLNLGEIAASEGDMGRADEMWTEAIGLAEGDTVAQADIARRAAERWVRAGDATRAQRWLRQELRAAVRGDAPAAFAWRSATAAALLGNLQPSEDGLEFFQVAARQFEELEDAGQATRVRLDIGKTLSDLGRHDEAVQELTRAYEDAQGLDDRTMQRTALANLGEVLRRADDLVGARRANEQALVLAEELGDRETIARCTGNLGLVALDSGELEEAERLFRHQLRLAQDLRDAQHEAFARGGLGSVELALGHPRRAARFFLKAADLQRGVWAVGEIENLEGLLAAIVASGQNEKLQEAAQRLVDVAVSSGLGPEASEAFARVARMLLKRRLMEEAADFYNGALRLQPVGERKSDVASQEALIYALGLMTAHVETELPMDEREPFYETFLASAEREEKGLAVAIRTLLNQVRESFEAQGVYDSLREEDSDAP